MKSDFNVYSIEELFQFAQGLSQLSADLVNSFNAANKQMENVLVGWDDQQSQAFQYQFREATNQINQIAEMMYNFSAYVNKYAEYISNAPRM